MVVKLGSSAAFHNMLVRQGGGTKFDNHGNPKKVSLNQDMDYRPDIVQTVGEPTSLDAHLISEA